MQFRINPRSAWLSRHTVVCKENDRRTVHKCVIYWYCKVTKFNLPYLQNYRANFYQIYIFSALHIHYFTYKIERNCFCILEIFVPENCLIFFTFFFFTQNYKYV